MAHAEAEAAEAAKGWPSPYICVGRVPNSYPSDCLSRCVCVSKVVFTSECFIFLQLRERRNLARFYKMRYVRFELLRRNIRQSRETLYSIKRKAAAYLCMYTEPNKYVCVC